MRNHGGRVNDVNIFGLEYLARITGRFSLGAKTSGRLRAHCLWGESMGHLGLGRLEDPSPIDSSGGVSAFEKEGANIAYRFRAEQADTLGIGNIGATGPETLGVLGVWARRATNLLIPNRRNKDLVLNRAPSRSGNRMGRRSQRSGLRAN